MTTIEAIEDLQRLVSGGIATDESKFDPAYMIAKLNQGRAVIARNDFKISKRWNPSLIQYFRPEYDTYFQNNHCTTRFTLPTGFINADERTIGLVYAGSSDDVTSNPYIAANFRRYKSRTEFQDKLKHPRMSATSGLYTGILIEGLTVTLTGLKKIKTFMVGGVFSDPTALPDFNKNVDEYPISLDLFQLVATYVYQQTLGIESAQVPDTLSDSKQTIIPNSMSAALNKKLMR